MLRGQSPGEPIHVRFWRFVDDSGDGCWNWTGSKSEGYGRFQIGHKIYQASRVAWEIAYGEIPDGLQVLHSCDNPSCVRISHLFLGTQEDNVQDCVVKGRLRPKGLPMKVYRA